MGEFTVRREGALVIVTIDHPEVGNALTRTAAVEMAEIFEGVSHGAGDVRAVLLQAAGKNFCTGADLSTVAGRTTADRPINGHMVREMAGSHHRLISAVFHCRAPVVAAVQGPAAGAGLHLALASDLVVAGERATFHDPFTDRGFSVDSGGSWLLPRVVGLARAKRFLYLGERLDAATALQWGLLTEVVPHDDLPGVAMARVEALAARPTQAVAATKRLLHDSFDGDLDQALHAESMAVELTLRSNDFKEGMNAVAAKRSPHFTGT